MRKRIREWLGFNEYAAYVDEELQRIESHVNRNFARRDEYIATLQRENTALRRAVKDIYYKIGEKPSAKLKRDTA